MQIPLALRTAAPVVRPHAGRLGVAGVLVLVQVAVSLLRPWPLAVAVDHALTGEGSPFSLPLVGTLGSDQVLWCAATATVVLSFMLGGLDLVLESLSEGTAEIIGAELRGRIFDVSISRSLRWHDRMRSGELMSRLLSDVGRMLDAIVAVTTTLVPDAVMVLGVLALVAHIDPELALVGLSVVPLLAVLSTWQRRLVRGAQGTAREASGRLSATSADLLRNVRVIQALGRVDRAQHEFRGSNRRVLAAEVAAVRVQARWMPVPEVVLAVGTALVLGVGGAHVLAGTLTVGGLLVVLAYLRDLYSPVRSLTRLSTVLAKASASAARVQEILGCEEAVTDRPSAPAAPLVINDVALEAVHFGYDHERPVIQDLNVTIRRGETLAVVGPSGTGKSTLLALLLRLYDVDAGRITLDGHDLRELSLESARSRFAYMPQDPWLLDASVADNIALGSSHASRAQVVAAGARALVDEFVHDLPAGYDTVLGEGALRLSGGQRRRVALARAVVSAAPVLLLDEPTSSLDPHSAEEVLRSISRAAVGRTTVIVTHDDRVAHLADRVLTLPRAGRTTAPGMLIHNKLVGR